jgi:hypothetical protein
MPNLSVPYSTGGLPNTFHNFQYGTESEEKINVNGLFYPVFFQVSYYSLSLDHWSIQPADMD